MSFKIAEPTHYQWVCSHGKNLSETCIECALADAREIEHRFGKLVDAARAKLAGEPAKMEEGGGSVSERTKPCDLPCPKCGSADVLRSFWAKGEHRNAREYNKQTMGKYASVSCSNAYATRDHIGHHCRVCHYEWQTLPMKAEKRAA